MDKEQVGGGKLSARETSAAEKAQKNAETLAKYEAHELPEIIAAIRKKVINDTIVGLDDEAFALYETLTDDEKRADFARSVEVRLPGIREKMRSGLDVLDEEYMSPGEWHMYAHNTTPEERDEDKKVRRQAEQAKKVSDARAEEERETARWEQLRKDNTERQAAADAESAVRSAALMAEVRARHQRIFDELGGQLRELNHQLVADIRGLAPVFAEIAHAAIIGTVIAEVKERRSHAIDVESVTHSSVNAPEVIRGVRLLTDQLVEELPDFAAKNEERRGSLVEAIRDSSLGNAAAKFFEGWPFAGKK